MHSFSRKREGKKEAHFEVWRESLADKEFKSTMNRRLQAMFFFFIESTQQPALTSALFRCKFHSGGALLELLYSLRGAKEGQRLAQLQGHRFCHGLRELLARVQVSRAHQPVPDSSMLPATRTREVTFRSKFPLGSVLNLVSCNCRITHRVFISIALKTSVALKLLSSNQPMRSCRCATPTTFRCC